MTCLVPGLPMTFGGRPRARRVRRREEHRQDDARTRRPPVAGDLRARSKALGVPFDRVYIDFADAVDYCGAGTAARSADRAGREAATLLLAAVGINLGVTCRQAKP